MTHKEKNLNLNDMMKGLKCYKDIIGDSFVWLEGAYNQRENFFKCYGLEFCYSFRLLDLRGELPLWRQYNTALATSSPMRRQ